MPTTLKQLADIKLSAHPESFQLETHGNRIFVNVPKSYQIAVIDRQRNPRSSPLGPLQKPRRIFRWLLTKQDHRLFVGCRNPAEVLVYDTESGKMSRSVFLRRRHRRFILRRQRQNGYMLLAARASSQSIRQQDDHYSQLAKIPTAAGARTALFVPNLSRLYLAVPHRNSQAAEIRVYEVVP